MKIVIATICFVLAVSALWIGLFTEYRQSSKARQTALAPTLPWAAIAAVFIVLGLAWIPRAVAWWIYPTVLLGSSVLFGLLLMGVSKRRE